MNANDIAERLKSVREESGLTQAEFAARLGISARAVQSYEYAEREMSISVLDQLYEVFGVNPVWLLKGDNAASRRLLSLDALTGLMVDLHKAFEQPIARSGQPTSYGERAVGWSYLVRDTLARGQLDAQAVDRLHKLILTR